MNLSEKIISTVIRNQDGQPLPTDLNGGFASDYLIDENEIQKRTAAMQKICLNCHGTGWVTGHWKQFENTIAESNAETLTATGFMRDIWKSGLAEGLERDKNPFVEALKESEGGKGGSAKEYEDLEDFIVCKPGRDYRRLLGI